MDKEELKAVEKAIMKQAEHILDYVQVACPVDNYKVLRARILRASNNCIRTIKENYNDKDISMDSNSDPSGFVFTVEQRTDEPTT